MPYYNNIPQATDRISQSQGQILANFADLQVAFSANHVALGIAGEGKHNITTYVPQIAVPIPLPNEMIIYNEIDALAPFNQDLWITSGAPNAFHVPFTKCLRSAGHGYTYLPSGIIMRWGLVQTPLGTNRLDINFATLGGPTFTNQPSFGTTGYYVIPPNVNRSVCQVTMIPTELIPPIAPPTPNFWSRYSFFTYRGDGTAADNEYFTYIAIGF